MAAAARDLQEQRGPQSTLDLAVRLAVSNVDGCDAAGVTMARPHEVETPAFTEEWVAVGDRLQLELGEGPCLDAIRQQHTVYSPSLGYDRRWPVWGPRVTAETGAQSVLSFQLFTHHDTVGALNLYSRTRDGFHLDDRADGLAIAAHVAVAVAASMKITNLESALGSRTVIGQAIGIIMERFDLRPDVAFAVLSRISSTEERKMRDLAAELVDTGRLEGLDATLGEGVLR